VKVLLLHQHFKTPQTGGAIRSYYLAKALVDQGIQTVVITAHNESNYKQESVEGIEVHYLPVAYNNRFGFYKRILSFTRFAWGAVRLASRFKDADLCYAISVPLTVGIAAMAIKTRFKIPYIFEVGDLWPDAPIQMGFISSKVFGQALYRLEKKIYSNAKNVVALSVAIKSSVERRCPGKSVHLIPNMADTEFFKPEKKRISLEKKFDVHGKFVISYTGAIGVANGLDYFLECARACQRSNLAVHFILCGEGAMLEGLRESAKRLELKNLSILPFRNRDGILDIMNVTDASFICYKPVPILETGSPNKYFDALAAGKLILMNFGGWIKEEIERERCGVFLEPGRPTDIVNKITVFMDDKQLLQSYQDAARRLAEREYSRKILTGRFLDVISRG
jgi:glycosyltransferase involved in cell wall biosynthesis